MCKLPLGKTNCSNELAFFLILNKTILELLVVPIPFFVVITFILIFIIAIPKLTTDDQMISWPRIQFVHENASTRALALK